MSGTLVPAVTNETRALFAIVCAGLVAGILDIASAFILAGMKGATPGRVLQFVASGFLGSKSFEGGLVTMILGLTLHFLIAFGAAAFFYFASRKLGFMSKHAVASGIAYGIAVHAFMNLIVLPLSAAKTRHTLSGDLTQIIIHMLLIGLPISLIVRYLSAASQIPTTDHPPQR